MRASTILTLVATALLAGALTAKAATINVPHDEPSVQAGIDAASPGDTVLVASGTYYEHDLGMKSGVCVMSESGSANCVTIDAQQQGRVFICEGVGGEASITGFTITGGLADRGGGVYCDDSFVALAHCVFRANSAYYDGGGLYCRFSSPTLRSCAFESNTADVGAGMFSRGFAPELTACSFTANLAGSDAGGMFCWGSSASLVDCTFDENEAIFAGAMDCRYCSPTLQNCVFRSNQASNSFGALWCDSSDANLTGCLFEANRATFDGGAVCCHGEPSAVFTDCTFVANHASTGGGLYSYYSSPTLTRCIIAFGTAGKAVMCAYDGTATLSCCNIFGNAGGNWVGCIAAQYGVNGNFSEDPVFCLESNPSEPYSLHEGSPCLPGNSPCGELVGAFGGGCGPVSAVEHLSWGAIKALYK